MRESNKSRVFRTLLDCIFKRQITLSSKPINEANEIDFKSLRSNRIQGSYSILSNISYGSRMQRTKIIRVKAACINVKAPVDKIRKLF